ncbi:somatomedin-B and thrombospondin type-1 domain-containing protein-like [Tigriopus californicus]|uniref:somatomedin-B and thrombospondin type-1 domain-containing protein-like n=1 Tax=Tigriopus californicus TaxID=6832 RepID=UPI0027DA6172|nr:somatomedin-B and thrombospondin type-1 domain-containing protein-like [Tigriopus californicus]
MLGILSCLVLVGLTSSVHGGQRGSCLEATRCCPGRDSSCIVNGLQSSGRYVDTPCYCDEGCLETGDCCTDYKEACSVKVRDCSVSSWSVWSTCDSSCGPGIQTRTRLITTHPSPGGKSCDPLEQKRTCLGGRCDRKYWKYKSPIRETAGLLPVKFYRKVLSAKKDWDVRENLFLHSKKLADTTQEKSENYWENEIEDGYQADQPSGSNFELTATDQSYCTVFELVKTTKACQNDKDFFKMQKGRRMCALCPEDAKRESLGNRCKGHGVDYQLTRWRSTVFPKCHGQWQRIYETRDCPCKNGADFIFV